MIVESLLAGSLWAYTEHLRRGGNSDAQKIKRIFRKAGLYVKYDGKEDTAKLLRSKKHEDFTEYVFRIPEGKSFKDFLKAREVLQDSLNSYKAYDFKLSKVREFDVKKNFKREVRKLVEDQSTFKEVSMSFDKVLKVYVYKKPLTDYFLYNSDFSKQCKGWEIPIGVSRQGIIKHDMQKHTLIAGLTDYGKTNIIKVIITALLEQKPNDTVLSLIDLKEGLAFNRFKGIPQLNCITTDLESTYEGLQVIQQQMSEVFYHLKENNYEDVKEAGIKKRHFIVIDEAAGLSSNGEIDKEVKSMKVDCERIITDIARRGRAAGFYLIYATQYPTTETIKSQVKAMCDARICLRLKSMISSQVVLDEEGAEKLPFIKGRAIYQTDRNTEIQTPYIENKYIEGVVQHVQSK